MHLGRRLIAQPLNRQGLNIPYYNKVSIIIVEKRISLWIEVCGDELCDNKCGTFQLKAQHLTTIKKFKCGKMSVNPLFIILLELVIIKFYTIFFFNNAICINS